MYYFARYRSPLGNLLLAGDDTGIVGLWFEGAKYFGSTIPRDVTGSWIQDDLIDKSSLLRDCIKWLDDYFAGKKPRPSSLPLAPTGSDFRQVVWKILTEIPYGELATYGQIAKEAARRMGKERMSAQAVGGAVGHNPITIIIPCHRVVGAGGNLTGYASGLERKIKLLEHEGIDTGRLFLPKK